MPYTFTVIQYAFGAYGPFDVTPPPIEEIEKPRFNGTTSTIHDRRTCGYPMRLHYDPG